MRTSISCLEKYRIILLFFCFIERTVCEYGYARTKKKLLMSTAKMSECKFYRITNYQREFLQMQCNKFDRGKNQMKSKQHGRQQRKTKNVCPKNMRKYYSSIREWTLNIQVMVKIIYRIISLMIFAHIFFFSNSQN